MGVINARKGLNYLTFKIVDNNPAAKALDFDLAGIECEGPDEPPPSSARSPGDN